MPTEYLYIKDCKAPVVRLLLLPGMLLSLQTLHSGPRCGDLLPFIGRLIRIDRSGRLALWSGLPGPWVSSLEGAAPGCTSGGASVLGVPADVFLSGLVGRHPSREEEGAEVVCSADQDIG